MSEHAAARRHLVSLLTHAILILFVLISVLPIFWMWMAAFFGMATKYAEGLLAIRYRTKDDNGHISGGPMYYILHGMGEKWRPLAIFFAVAGVLVALFGIGTMTQVNSITGSLQASFGTAPEVASVVIALVVSTIDRKSVV